MHPENEGQNSKNRITTLSIKRILQWKLRKWVSASLWRTKIAPFWN